MNPNVAPPKFNIAPERWWDGLFSGAMLNFQGVHQTFPPQPLHQLNCPSTCVVLDRQSETSRKTRRSWVDDTVDGSEIRRENHLGCIKPFK